MNWVSENQVFRVRGKVDRFVRVIWVEPGAENLFLFDLGDPSALPRMFGYSEFLAMADAGEVEPCLEEPASTIVPRSSSLSTAARDRRDKLMTLIRPLVEDPERKVLYANRRHALFKDVTRTAGKGRNQMYRLLRLWWAGGQVANALAPRFAARGGPGKARVAGEVKRGRPVFVAGTERLAGINVSAEVAEKLQSGRRFLLAGRSWTLAYDDTMILHFSERKLVDGQPKVVVLDAGLIPTIHQFRYWVSKVVKPEDIERAVRGDAAYERNKAERSGSSREGATGPGAIFQIDATVANLYLRSRNNPRKLVGRPVLYLVTDQYSSMIVGFTVALSPPSWEVAKLAFENAFTDKVASCEALGIRIRQEDWPSRHVCVRVTGDRGSEVIGDNLGTAALGLGTSIVNLPPFRPDLKGLVEGRFEWLDSANISWAPGATHGRKRGDKDDRPHHLDGHYDLGTFRRFIVACIIRHNATLKVKRPPLQYPMTEDRSPTPNDLWNHGCRYLGAPCLVPREEVRANLLHVGEARLKDDGLGFEQMTYVAVSKAGRDASNRLSGRHWPKLAVRYDPRDVSTILVQVKDGALEPYALAPHDKRFDGWTLEEVKVFKAARVAADAIAENARFANEVRFRGDVVDLGREAEAVAASSRGGGARVASTKRIRLKADKETKASEIRDDRREGAWTSLPSSKPRPATVPATGARPVAPAPAAVRSLKPDRTGLLRRNQEAELARLKEKKNG